MTIFAGVVCRRPNASPPPDLCDAMRRSLSRASGESAIEIRYPHAWLAKVDLGAFGASGLVSGQPGATSLLAGEPLLATDAPDVARTRHDDLQILHSNWQLGDETALQSARGAFCAAHYDPARARLLLVADKLALRPIYYHADDDHIVFATALRVLEGAVRAGLDLRALTEMATLGIALGDRTPYDTVRALHAAEIIEFRGGDLTRRRYWRWDDIAPSTRPHAELVHEAYARFQSAVAVRLRGAASAAAFLSGGLDSRCVVTALRDRGVRVRTFNFGVPGTQDESFGAEYARAVGTAHVNRPMPSGGEPKFSMLMASALRETAPPAPAHIVWSGDGGSLGTGHIYQTQAMIDDLRAGRDDSAIERYLQQQGAQVSRRLFQNDIAGQLADMPRQGIREELADLHCADPGRKVHFFLLLNDQRRHLWNHFEDIDLHRLEFQLPFFDSDFLESMAELTIDRCLYHRFYAEWLECFPPVIMSVPWQAYPGHVPCPIRPSGQLVYQWGDGLRMFRAKEKDSLLRRAAELVDAEEFPHDLMNRRALRVASWVYRSGAADYGYVIHQANLFYSYWRRARHSPPGGGAHAPPQRTRTMRGVVKRISGSWFRRQ